MRCPKCGEEVADGMAFCGHCGARVAAPVPTSSEPAGKPVDAGDPALPSLDEEPAAGDAVETEETTDLPEPPAPKDAGTKAEPVKETAPNKKRNRMPAILVAVLLLAIVVAAIVNGQSSGSSSNGSDVADQTAEGSATISQDASGEAPWCVGKWYGVMASTTGSSGLGALGGKADGSDCYLEVKQDGTAYYYLSANGYSGTWEKPDGSDDEEKPYYLLNFAGSGSWGVGPVTDVDDMLIMVNASDTDTIIVFSRKTPGEFGSSGSGSSSSSGSSSGKGSGSSKSGGTVGQQNALDSAKSYLKHVGGFSEKSLREQLDYEGFSSSEIDYAIKYCGADWNEQCAQSAKGYMDMGGFSRKSLREQLEYEGFTSSQIEYGLKSVGY